VGGHCIAVDPWFIVDAAPDVAQLIRKAREVNDGKPHYVVDQVKASAGQFHSPVIACLGLAFKADVDDLRESPAMDIVQHLVAEKVGRVIVVEPHISELPITLKGSVDLASIDAAVDAADVVVLLVNHKEFLEFNRRNLEGKSVVDTRGVWR
jgi:UDP-N-acetyl-D-mannosaminuronic acid dehydrogenase